MRKFFALTLTLIISIVKSQNFYCDKSASINESNKKSAWQIVNSIFNSYEKDKKVDDKNMFLCLLTKLDQFGDLKATSFLAQGYLYGLPIFGGKDVKKAEKYFLRLSDVNDFKDIAISKKNLNISLQNLYSENLGGNEKEKLLELLKKRADKFNDEFSSYYLGDFYRYEKGYEKESIYYLEKSCKLGENNACSLYNDYKNNPNIFFKVLKTTTGIINK